MVKDHARKKATRAAAAAAGLSYDQVDDDVRHDAGESLMVVDYPRPDLGGADPCPACSGAGMSGDVWQERGDGSRPPLQVGTVCRSCLGCGRAGHEGCRPGLHAGDDPAEAADWRFEHGEDDGSDGGGEVCPSCRGERFWFLQAFGEDTEESAAARAELEERAGGPLVDLAEVQMMAAFGELDSLLGAGAQELARRADTTVYVRMPCGCAEEFVRTVKQEGR